MPADAALAALVATPRDPDDDYPLARKLYLGILIGFEACLEHQRMPGQSHRVRGAVAAVQFAQ